MSDKQTLDSRPLSPHLQVYKPQITSILSISHRISGVFLSLGLITMSLFVLLLAIGKDSFFLWILFSTSFLGEVILFGWVFAGGSNSTSSSNSNKSLTVIITFDDNKSVIDYAYQSLEF